MPSKQPQPQQPQSPSRPQQPQAQQPQSQSRPQQPQAQQAQSPSRPQQPTVLVGVTGCIATYKTCEIIRLLQKAGARVKVVMTPMGASFVTAETFKALTREPVALEPIDSHSAPIHHITLAQEADVFLIAPCTANTLNKLAHGVADNLLTTTALATEAPLLLAPAMNVHMWRDPCTQESLGLLRARGVQIIEPEAGLLACGEVGEGRLAPIDQIAEKTVAEFARARDLAGKRILVTAGATREQLDPVRYLSSPSSGITGYAIAQEAARRGAEVTLVSGPTNLPDPFGCRVQRVGSALEMFVAAQGAFAGVDAAIFSAAVADFRPETRVERKIKKDTNLDADGSLTLKLVQNPDILATLAADKGSTYVVGFAAETNDVLAAARKKLATKHADLIVANDVSNPALGFGSTHNKVWFVTAQGTEESALISKTALARVLLDKVVAAL
ncbi:MAG: bifunctional phosphopantothenoylcysteine decarboxylase/phosphopantothenate--cysteine ligase CoaBC [Coriobacteriales bacterium]|jgi:phosphopantothenoylcysteine decarboxylase/phosphopantothenate--cysteine ligase|nr:bifunctional phosphopantothenoylcysteine decarboxylase/phosphopantothenate--cysteine ligase CoaBC [Coriobacteriales bacterium]